MTSPNSFKIHVFYKFFLRREFVKHAYLLPYNANDALISSLSSQFTNQFIFDVGSSHGSGETRSGDQVVISAPEVSHLGWGHWYTLRELEEAINGFADENVIGEGGYGIVYMGVFEDNSQVAVKNLLNNRGQAEEEFKVEVEAIGRVRHTNLVRLLGYCAEGAHSYVAPEYASTGMLNERSDVYSFGILLMEIISSRNPVDYSRPPGEVNLVEWLKSMVTNQNAEGVFDPKMVEKPSSRALKRALLVALRCVDPNAQKRPKMGHVIHMLEADDFPFRDKTGKKKMEETMGRMAESMGQYFHLKAKAFDVGEIFEVVNAIPDLDEDTVDRTCSCLLEEEKQFCFLKTLPENRKKNYLLKSFPSRA